jgi:hypothetical protein
MTPNMNLLEPVIAVDSGLVWEQSINANTSVLDAHNHTPGNGVPIPTSGININADLNFNSFNETSLRSSRFNSQSSPLSGALDLGCIYVSGVDLYYNDGNGNKIKITSGGTVNATSSGIVSGTATASFVSSVLVVNENTNTPANIQAGSILLGNNTSGSNFITLGPPSALSENYNLTLPSGVPVATSFLTIDSSGNLATGVAYSHGITNAQIANNTITATQIANNTITATQITSGTLTPTQSALSRPAYSVQTASLTTASTSYVFTNTSLSYTNSGVGCVRVEITSDNGALNGDSYLSITSDATLGNCVVRLALQEDGTTVAFWDYGFYFETSGTSQSITFPVSFTYTSTTAPSSGSHSYALYAKFVNNPNTNYVTTTLNGIKIVISEL